MVLKFYLSFDCTLGFLYDVHQLSLFNLSLNHNSFALKMMDPTVGVFVNAVVKKSFTIAMKPIEYFQIYCFGS
jgi:hypothetical protein